jgi:hypothetical protein
MGHYDFPENDPVTQDLREAAPPPAEASSGDVKTVEKWAEAKGLWPQTFAAPTYGLPGGGSQAGGSVAVDMGRVTGPRVNPEYWRFAAAKASCGWPEGKELTEAEFDAAIQAAGEHVGR